MKFLLRYSDILKKINDTSFIKIFKEIISDINKIYILIDTEDFSLINDIKKEKKVVQKYENKLMEFGFPFHRVILSKGENVESVMERNHFDVLLTNSFEDEQSILNNEFIDCVNLNDENYEIESKIKKILSLANESLIDPENKITDKPSQDKIWLKYYNKKALRDLKRFSLNNSSIFEHICSQNKDFMYDVAIDYYGNEITFSDLKENVIKYQKSFINLGVKKNDTVAICAPNVPDSIYAYFAIQNIGAVPSMLHVYSKANDMDYYFKKENVKFIVMIGMQETFENIDLAIEENHNIEKVVVVPLTTGLFMKSFESIKTMLGVKVLSSKLGKFVLNSKSIIKKYKLYNNNLKLRVQNGLFSELLNCYQNIPDSFKMPKNNRYISLSEFLKNGENTILKNSYNDVSTIIHTGGTTGIGKSTMLSHKNINRNDDAFEATIQDFKRGDTIITIPPLFHILGLNNCIALILRNGGKIVLISKYRKNDLPAIFKKHHPELLFGVPKIGRDIINNDDFDDVDLSHLKYYVLGGEEMSKKFVDESSKFLTEHGAKIDISQSLGATEGTCSYTNTFNNCNIHGSVGIPLINLNVKIIKEDKNGNITEVGYNEYGEICFQGDSIMMGYFNDLEASKSVLKEHNDGNIWLHTGDCGYINEDGILFFVDRIKDMFKINGEQVYPSEIKKVIIQHPKVKDCAVFCIETEDDKKKIVASITLDDVVLYSKNIEQEILQLCATCLRKESIPQYIEVRDTLPETNLFKTDMKQIKKEYNEKIKTLNM